MDVSFSSSLQVEKLQASACESSEQAVRAESELASVREEKSRLAQALDAMKDNAERQVLGLEKENEQLSQALDNIRERSEKTNDARVGAVCKYCFCSIRLVKRTREMF